MRSMMFGLRGLAIDRRELHHGALGRWHACPVTLSGAAATCGVLVNQSVSGSIGIA